METACIHIYAKNSHIWTSTFIGMADKQLSGLEELYVIEIFKKSIGRKDSAVDIFIVYNCLFKFSFFTPTFERFQRIWHHAWLPVYMAPVSLPNVHADTGSLPKSSCFETRSFDIESGLQALSVLLVVGMTG